MEREVILDEAKAWVNAKFKDRGGLAILAESEGEKINFSAVTGGNSKLAANAIFHLMERNRDFAKVILHLVNKYKNEHPFCEIEIP